MYYWSTWAVRAAPPSWSPAARRRPW